MNGIKATYNFTIDQWTIETIDLQPNNNSLEFVFISENEYSDLTDCQFGFRLESNGEVLKSSKFPPEGVQYFQISKNPWFLESFSLVVGQEYKLLVYLMSPTDTKESQIAFVGPKPTQPFPSWTWENNQWIAPHPKPAGPYLWNEPSQQWEQAEPNFPYPSN
jgi:hypothetical protein